MNANRRFLCEMLGSGLDVGTVTPDDVLRHVTPEILAHHLPVTLKARLLEASLSAERVTPTLVVETLGVQALAEHCPIGALWTCLSECARRVVDEDDLGAPAPSTSSPAEGSGEVKPAKAARPNAGRMSGRISALSPRSRNTIQRARTDDDGDLRRPDPEFDIDEDDPPSSLHQTREVTPDEETRPGDITGSRKS